VSSLAGILAIMLRALAIRYAVAWTPGAFAQFQRAIGGGAIGWWDAGDTVSGRFSKSSRWLAPWRRERSMRRQLSG